MTKLDLTVSAETLECISYDEPTAKILGLNPPSQLQDENLPKVPLSHLLADEKEMQQLESAVEKLTRRQESSASTFETLNLVFRAPNAPEAALAADRSPLGGVFCSPMRAIHASNHLQLSCFTHIHYDADQNVLRISALEYSRTHRSDLLRQEFSSWLVEEHIGKAVIATKADGTVVYWNRFATSLYQYEADEAIGQEIRNLISSKLSREQGDEMMKRLNRGEDFTGMYLCSRKDKTDFVAHATSATITNDEGKVQFIVGVSADYSQLHNVMVQLEQLNANLESEVVARTEQLLTREKHLRMIGAAMKESDTGVLITDQHYKINWCNDAVSRMLGLKKNVIRGMFPWDLPLQQEQKQELAASEESHSNLLMPEGKSSSLESYFLQEMEFNASSSSHHGRGDSSQTEVDVARRYDDAHEGEEGESSAPTNKRPPVAAICYRIDSPSMPLHIMVSVEAMPPEEPRKLVRTRSSPVSRPFKESLGLSEVPVGSFISLDPSNNTTQVKDEVTGVETKVLESTAMQFMITLRDITAERKAEEAQLIAERASAANEAKTQMMQMLSHELRTPLQGIMGVASTSMMDIEDFDNSTATNSNYDPNGNPGSGGVKGTMYDSLSTILASSRLLLTLINNTLDTRKINADMMHKIELSTVSMMACIRDSFQYCGPFAAINEAILELADPGGEKVKLQQILKNSKSNLMVDILRRKFNVVGNRLRLEQVIVNLLSNGIKYTTPGTSVVASVRNSSMAQALTEIKSAPSSSLKFLSEEEMKDLEAECEKNGGDVTIFSVRDHGKGIPPGEYGKVFGEFQQLEASAEKDNKYDGSGSGQSSGSGLGLNLSMKFVTLMNGHIWFQNCSDGGNGAIFSFYLKRAQQDRDARISFANPSSTSTRALSEGSGRSSDGDGDEQELREEKLSRIRVLLIDDSMINLKVLARMMTKLKVQHCKTALSGAAALEYLEPIRNDPSLVPNLILCDLQMPGMDGYELMSHLREMDICSSPIVMACSADWGSETEGKCHDVGFDGLLRKPITVTYLKEFLANSKL